MRAQVLKLRNDNYAQIGAKTSFLNHFLHCNRYNVVRSLLCPETIEGLQSIWTLFRLTFREDVYFVNCPVDTYNYK